MFGRPPPLLLKLGEEKVTEVKSSQALHITWQETHQLVPATRTTAQHPVQPHNHAPGGWIWVRKVQPASFEPHWDRPFSVILTTPIAIKAAGRRHWIHHTKIKAAHPPQTSEQCTLHRTEDPLKIRLSRVQSGPS
uniref:Murine leukemia virus integrase C-terminal domain-containing protein n=1 Tax=Rousettus aegyptiacus TaxID=9407 RepID=A0A7J8D6C0_ROUAE|nr:hypothetical protein HJG63_008746 [Rousettus aegyptiacus]